VTDASGDLVPNLVLEWSSSDPSIVDVDAAGGAGARSEGIGIVTATIVTVAGQGMVEVQAPEAPTPEPELSRRTLCPDPALRVLDDLEASVGDPATPQEPLREVALACWGREGELGAEERAYAAWLIGQITYDLEGCEPDAVRWFERAVRLDSGSQAYRVALEGCGG
jgi:hypothetical protein